MTQGTSQNTTRARKPVPPHVVAAARLARRQHTAPSADDWSIETARELYQVRAWGQGFFDINEAGNVVIRPHREQGTAIDLYEVIQGLHEREIQTPVLVNFTDLLDQRARDLHQAFSDAIKENEYRGNYIAAYPIKVNQQRHLVERIHANCNELGFGLEVGSKPELLAVLGMTTETPNMPIICNGFKESRYIDFVTLAKKLGRNIIPVVENINELTLVLQSAEKFGVRPRLGIRMKLDSKGAGRWRYSSGARAKFGLTLTELLECFEILKQRDMLDCFELLHCHIGSQIHDIRRVNDAVNELTRLYVELAKMGAGLKYLDVGGGLGVDYDGSQTDFEFSMNYSLAEYASNVVYRVMAVCDDEEVPHPTIITECGRAMVAHQAVLVFDVLGANRLDRYTVPHELVAPETDRDELPRPIIDLLVAYETFHEDRLLEFYHDAAQARDEAITLFTLGHMSLEHRAMAERLYWSICVRVRDICRTLDVVPEELQDIETELSDTYFCNLSIFQSMPDSWAIDQLFPIMPIHRLNEAPSRLATLADITCDSDGKIDRFIDPIDVKSTIELHPVKDGERYYVAAFLVGAYQETLGDLHNLFGDTHIVHVRLGHDGDAEEWWIDDIVEGDTIREVLSFVQYDVQDLHQRFRRECERAVRMKKLSVADSRSLFRSFEQGLWGYTYLE
jgi:arginine decarboxylase